MGFLTSLISDVTLRQRTFGHEVLRSRRPRKCMVKDQVHSSKSLGQNYLNGFKRSHFAPSGPGFDSRHVQEIFLMMFLRFIDGTA